MDLSNSDMGQKDNDMKHGHFLNLTGDIENIKRQRHATCIGIS